MDLQTLQTYSTQLKVLAEKSHVGNLRVFGSVAKKADCRTSDVDLLVDVSDETSLFDLGRMQQAAEELLGVKVDLLTADELPESFRTQVLSEALAI